MSSLEFIKAVLGMGDTQVQGLKGTVSLKTPPWMGDNSAAIQELYVCLAGESIDPRVSSPRRGTVQSFVPSQLFLVSFIMGWSLVKPISFRSSFPTCEAAHFCILLASFQDRIFQLGRNCHMTKVCHLGGSY